MIALLDKGEYRLIETHQQVKILYLGSNCYAWVHVNGIGEILITSHVPHQADYVLATGAYRLYSVNDETRYRDQQHLELHVGDDTWQGYLLPVGLPDDVHSRRRLIPTKEVISTSSHIVIP